MVGAELPLEAELVAQPEKMAAMVSNRNEQMSDFM